MYLIKINHLYDLFFLKKNKFRQKQLKYDVKISNMMYNEDIF